MLIRVLRFVCFTSLLLFVACTAATPTPLPLPTRMQPEDTAQRALASALSELEYDLTQAQSLLRFIANSAQVRSGSAQECSAYLHELLVQNPRYAQLGATTPTGVLFCDSERRNRTVSVADRLYFSRAISERDFVVGEFVIGRVTLSPSLGLAYPVLGEGDDLRGIVMAPLRLSWLAQRFSEISIPVTGEMVIIDTYGNLLLRDPDATDWFGKNISETQLGAEMLSKLHGAGEFGGADGETRFYTFDSPRASDNQLIVAVGVKR